MKAISTCADKAYNVWRQSAPAQTKHILYEGKWRQRGNEAAEKPWIYKANEGKGKKKVPYPNEAVKQRSPVWRQSAPAQTKHILYEGKWRQRGNEAAEKPLIKANEGKGKKKVPYANEAVKQRSLVGRQSAPAQVEWPLIILIISCESYFMM